MAKVVRVIIIDEITGQGHAGIRGESVSPGIDDLSVVTLNAADVADRRRGTGYPSAPLKSAAAEVIRDGDGSVRHRGARVTKLKAIGNGLRVAVEYGAASRTNRFGDGKIGRGQSGDRRRDGQALFPEKGARAVAGAIIRGGVIGYKRKIGSGDRVKDRLAPGLTRHHNRRLGEVAAGIRIAGLIPIVSSVIGWIGAGIA